MGKIKKQILDFLTKNDIALSYDSYKCDIYVNDEKYSNKRLKDQDWYLNFKVKVKNNNDKEVIDIIRQIAKFKSFNSKEIKDAEREEKEAEREAKRLEKETLRAEKEAEKEAERIEKERIQKLNEEKLKTFIDNFNYEVLDNVAKNDYRNVIMTMMYNNGLKSTSQSIATILTKKKVIDAQNQRKHFEDIGYIVDDKGQPDNSLPQNYEIFFDNYFMNGDEWDKIDDKKKIKDKGYCYYDEWSSKFHMYYNNKICDATPERFRTIVRQFAPLNNVYIVNDIWQDWIMNNREGNYLKNYIKSLKWDGIDRLGVNMNNNEMNNNKNIILEVLDVEQNSLNKKMINYSMIHACRQIFFPTKYNFQHVCSLLGDTNCGKTKTLKDLFTFPCGIYYCEGVDITGPAWTWGARLMEVVANIWNEKQGINGAANEMFKNFIDIINGQIVYQPKNKNEFVNRPSHNICFITYNPKQKPLLSDYSVSYEKRYWILECKRTEEDFKNKYLHTIEAHNEQIWAQLYEWVINNMELDNELNENEVKALKLIQSNNKGITENEVKESIHYWLNEKTYNLDKIVNLDEVKISEKNINNYEKTHLNAINNNAFNSLLTYIGLDSRHKSFINDKLLNELGWEKKNVTIRGTTYYCLHRIKEDQFSLPI